MASLQGSAARGGNGSDSVSQLALWLGIVVAPLSWSAQELVSYGVVSRLCSEREAANAMRTAASAEPLFLLISAALLLLTLAGAMLAWRNWLKVRDVRRASNLSREEIHAERSRFLGRVALICNVGALAAFAFTISTLFVAPLCPG
jgi:hypothetical protein